jgi:formylglycine-generating enzyme required for sulfatase activity
MWHVAPLNIVVAALIIVGLSTTALAEKRGVKIEGKDPAAYVAAQYGKSWAVVIGINAYQHGIPNLHYAVADAQAVGQELERRGFSVIRLMDQQATSERIRAVLGDELPARMKPDDRLVVFYAGHGETRTIIGGQPMGYLLPVNAHRERLHGTAINMAEIRNLAALLPSKHVLFLVDVCYGGIAGQQFRSLPPQTESYLKQITREPGRQLITAGGAGQQVVEGPQWGHSVFTYFLLKGLRDGLADLNLDGIIPASELYAYLDGRVPAESDGQQRPELWSLSSEKGEFVFFASALKAAAPVDAPLRSPAVPSDEVAAMKKRMEEMERRLAEKAKPAQEEPKPVEVARARPYEQPRHQAKEITGKDGASMVLVPGGEFTMASGSATHRVTLEAFYLDKLEVTVARYGKFLSVTKRKEPDNWGNTYTYQPGQPITNVSWDDAFAYCQWAGKRLPSEAEWEKAARGTDGRLYPWGNDPPDPKLANYQVEGQSSTSLKTVGSYEDGKSPYGAHDMAGNAWEWVADWYDEDYYRHGPNQNPPGPASGDEKVIRGGSWDFKAPALLAVSRMSYPPSMKTGFIGFRCAQDAGH